VRSIGYGQRLFAAKSVARKQVELVPPDLQRSEVIKDNYEVARALIVGLNEPTELSLDPRVFLSDFQALSSRLQAS
jgi:hypothetical protein